MATGVQLWGNTYDRAAAEVASVQDEIASAIMDEGIRLKLSGDERRRLVRHFTDDPEAYEWYLRARHAVIRGSEADILEARELLVRATTRDPQFALAYNALAASYVTAVIEGTSGRPTRGPGKCEQSPRLSRSTRSCQRPGRPRGPSRSFPSGTGRRLSVNSRSPPKPGGARFPPVRCCRTYSSCGRSAVPRMRCESCG